MVLVAGLLAVASMIFTLAVRLPEAYSEVSLICSMARMGCVIALLFGSIDMAKSTTS